MHIDWLTLSVGAFSAIAVARIIHCLRRAGRRKCDNCKGKTRRVYQMIPLRRSYWQSYTFKECKVCGQVTLVRSDDKRFLSFEIWWRRFWNKGQFEIKSGIFVRAGLNVRRLPLTLQDKIQAIRVERFEMLKSTQSGQSHKLPKHERDRAIMWQEQSH